jgi:hypothetical protein
MSRWWMICGCKANGRKFSKAVVEFPSCIPMLFAVHKSLSVPSVTLTDGLAGVQVIVGERVGFWDAS